MLIVVGFGLLMMFFSIIMIINPNYWSKSIIDFSNKHYFHWFEILSRFIVGILFVMTSDSSQSPNLAYGIGVLLLLVSFGLLALGPTRHKTFAVWSAAKFKSVFRISGIASFTFGVYLIYSS